MRYWRGIPFAEPPVGNLRWRAPQRPQKWSGVRNTTDFGNDCKQLGPAWISLNKTAVKNSSEDCVSARRWQRMCTWFPATAHFQYAKPVQRKFSPNFRGGAVIIARVLCSCT